MSHGVIYYNNGTSCAVRLLISIYTLRKHYTGQITILSEGDETISEKIASMFKADFKKISLNIPTGKNAILLAKPKIYEVAPYDNNLWLDADTIILNNIDDIFEIIEKNSLVVAQFSNWKTNEGIIAKRINMWKKFYPELTECALSFGPAINCGVVGFRKNATIFNDWYDMSLVGRRIFIADESCLQLIIGMFEHKIVDPIWNTSCKYGEITKNTKIIHFHGKKHCRIGDPVPFNGQLWLNIYYEVLKNNILDVQSWTPSDDETLDKFLRWKNGKTS